MKIIKYLFLSIMICFSSLNSMNLDELPTDMLIEIISQVISNSNLEESLNSIKSFFLVNKTFYKLINDKAFAEKIIKLLLNKFDLYNNEDNLNLFMLMFHQKFSSIHKELQVLPVKEDSQKITRYLNRKLILIKNNQNIGYIAYEISLFKDSPSYINFIEIDKKYRGLYGYGKILMIKALSEIFSQGSRVISLFRRPFDLMPEDNVEKRDAQLKRWYEKFGFEDVDQYSFEMILNKIDKYNQIKLAYLYLENDMDIKYSEQ